MACRFIPQAEARFNVFCVLRAKNTLDQVGTHPVGFLRLGSWGARWMSKIGGIPELIDEGETGYLFEPSDKESLVEAVQKMLGEKQNFAAMGKRARKKAEREFAPETHRTKIVEIYNQYLNKN